MWLDFEWQVPNLYNLIGLNHKGTIVLGVFLKFSREAKDGVSPHTPKYFFSIKKYSKNLLFPQGLFLKDNPELHFNPGAADKWIKHLGNIEHSKISSMV
jgi:hypothetical protein